jgi:hypothetical protein
MDRSDVPAMLVQLDMAVRDIEERCRAVREMIAATQAAAGPPTTKPTVKMLVLETVRKASKEGRHRDQIMDTLARRHGIVVSTNTATGTLQRLRREGLIRRSGGAWFPVA